MSHDRSYRISRRITAVAVLAAVVFAIPAVLRPPPAEADCTDSSGVRINEVRYVDANSPVGDRMNALVELYNKGTLAVDLGGWTITDHDAVVKATLPVLSLPGGAFLVVEFGTGATDLDFSDGLGRIATHADSVDIFDEIQGGVALYAGAPSLANIRDFVAWSADGFGATGAAASDAVTAGLWPVGESVAVTDSSFLFSIRLLPDGADANNAASWNHHGWGESWYQSFMEGPNPLMIEPVLGSAAEPGPVTLSWATAQQSGFGYHVVVATDPGLTSGIVVDGLSASADTSVTLTDGFYYWSVSLVDSCGETAGVVWSFDVFAPPWAAQTAPGGSLSPQAFGTLTVPRLTQHRDSRLLCLYDARNNARPGCREFAGAVGPWDSPHPANHATGCLHCGWYCVRASSQMINRFYGGNLTQDRIAFALNQLESRLAVPEKNLDHGRGVLPIEIEGLLEFCLTGENVTAQNATYAGLKAEIQAGRPVLVTRPGHAMVVAGFIDEDQLGPGRPAADMIRLVDPWPTQQASRLRVFSLSQVTTMWTIAALAGQTVGGRNEEAEVSTDTDGDGVMDFDEGAPNYPLERPRRLQSRHNDIDTDNDDVHDKWEIRGYTFYTCGSNDSLGFPDVDFDGLRAESDCDTDNGSLFDGGEDITGRGLCNNLTNPYVAAGDGIGVSTDKGLYFPGDPVYLTGAPFRADSSYQFANIIGCPPLVDGQAIGAAGALATNGTGTIPFQQVATCGGAALWLTVVDVLHNNRYEDPLCKNPKTCWTCLDPIYRTSLDAMPEWGDLAIVEYTPGSVTWAFTPDGFHNGTGFYAELNGPGNPSNPIDVGLRAPQGNADPGDQVFLTFWTAFFSQGMQGIVRVSTDNGNNWTPVHVYDPQTNGFNGIQELDITQALFGPAPQNGAARNSGGPVPFLVEFHAIGPPASGGWFVDDIGIGRIPGGTSDVPGDDPPPVTFMLAQNSPNPFAGSTAIGFEVPAGGGHVSLEVYDVAGRRVRTLLNGTVAPGRHVRIWDGRGESGALAPAGVYFYRLTGNEWEAVRRMSRVVR